MRSDSNTSMQRREFLGAVAGATLAAALPTGVYAAGTGPVTAVYKTVGNCQIKLDVHGAAPGERKAALMWIHGGALIMGSRLGVDRRLATELLKRDIAIVSIDYRLAPETKLPELD